MTKDQLRQLTQAIADRFGFIAGQIQSVDYQPPADLLQRWKNLGLVEADITPETFMATVPAEMQFIRSAFLMGKFIEAVEAGTNYETVMALARYAPILEPDLAAIAIAEQQTADFITNNAADLATEIGRLWAKQQAATVRSMAIDYHEQKLNRIELDAEEKELQGVATPPRPVENWRQFSSELHHTMDDKARDWDRVAFYEITDAQKQGQAHALLADGNVNKLVYKRPMTTACAQCKHLYLMPDGVTPRVFKLAGLINNGTNIGRKAHPIKGGKVNPVGRTDGAEALKAVAGLVHPWCQCQGPYPVTGYETWYRDTQPITKSQLELFTEQHTRQDTTRHLASGAAVQVHNTTAAVHIHHSGPTPSIVVDTPQQETTMPNLKEQLEAYKPMLAEQFALNTRERLSRFKQTYGPTMRDKSPTGVALANSTGYNTWLKLAPITTRDANRHYQINEPALAAAATAYADDTVTAWYYKITSKLADLQNTKVIHMDGCRFIITGERDGKKVSIEQDMIVNSSSRGTLYNQFPARIYVDGKFTPESAYKKLIGADKAEAQAAEAKRQENMLPSGKFAKGDKVTIWVQRPGRERYTLGGKVKGERNDKTIVRTPSGDFGIETGKLAEWNPTGDRMA